MVRRLGLLFALLVATSAASAEPIKKMEFRNQEIRDILLGFGALNGVSIVPDETVEGTASYVFSNMEFEQALAAFLETVGLTDTLSSGIHRISKVLFLPQEGGKFSLSAADIRISSLIRVLSARSGKTILNDGVPNEPITVRLDGATVLDVLKVVVARYPQFQVVQQDQYFHLKSVSQPQGLQQQQTASTTSLTSKDGLYSIDLTRGRFKEVLQQLFNLAGKEYISLLDRDVTLEDLRLKSKPFEDLLSTVLLYASADFIVDKGVYTIVEAQKRDLVRKYLSNIIVPLEYLSVTELNRVLPQEMNSGAGFKVDDRGNKVILSGTPEQIKPLFDFLKTIDRPFAGNKLVRIDLEYAKTDEVLPLLPADLTAFGPQPLPARTGFLIAVPSSRIADLQSWRQLVDQPADGVPIRLRYLKSDELFARLPPSATESSLARTNDPGLVFYRGTPAQRAKFLRDLKEIDVPRAQIRYEILVMQFDEGVGLNLKTTPSVTAVGTGSGNSIVGEISELVSMNVDVIADFGYQFAVSLTAALKNNKSKVLADTTLNGLSGEKIVFQNTQTNRYQDNQLNPDTGKYIPVIRDLPSGLLLNLEGWASTDGMISVKIDSTLSEAVATESASGSAPPSTFEKKLSTQIRTPSGKPLVISGLKQDRVATVVSKLPLLGDIPWIGVLFQQRTESVTRTEFAIYIVPIVERPDRRDPGSSELLDTYFRRLVGDIQ